MPVQQTNVGKNPSGENIYLFSLSNEQGHRVVLTNYGATLMRYEVPVRGKAVNIVLGFEDPADYQRPEYLAQYPWMGSAVGRYANRIGRARFSLDGKEYQLEANNGPHLLHGGKQGFDRKTWAVEKISEEEKTWVQFFLRSPEGDEGFPGQLDVHLRFELTGEGSLLYHFSARSTQATPCNLTHHPYFNLNNGKGDILDHEVMIPAGKILAQDDELVATGELVDVKNTPYDFRSYKKIRAGLKQVAEYDKSFLIDNPGGKMNFVAALRYRPAGLQLQVFSTDPILHFYSGKWIPDLRDKSWGGMGPWSGLCLETHSYPNAVNIPAFPSNILRPGEVYRGVTVFRVGELTG